MTLRANEHLVPDVFNSWEPDPFGNSFGIGGSHFRSSFGIDGIAWVDEDRLLLLAISAAQPGTGQLRAFMQRAKEVFAHIVVVQIENPLLKRILAHYGFKAQRVKINGWEHEKHRAFVWHRP